mgnify:CR=1 FL=1
MLRPFLKYITTRGFRVSVEVLLHEVKVNVRHRVGVFRAREFAHKTGLKLNIGCGPKLKAGWVNIDLSPNADLTLDLREPLPFAEGACQVIYSEHFLEHLDYPDPTNSFLEVCFRILEAGGTFSVGVPDTEWPILEYTGQSQEGYFKFVKQQWHPKWCETEMEHLNYHFRMENHHRFAYDFKTLKLVLSRAGFVDIQHREFDPALDSQDRKIGSLYVTARKPSLIS